MEALLSLSHVSFSYHTVDGETLALSDINFSVNSGEFAAIVGPSGCGKSTLLSLICGLIQPESGEIRMTGRRMDPSRGIGYMLQRDHLFEWRSVYDNILLGLEIQKKLTPQNINRVDRMLETYGLSSFARMKPQALSGGMKQRAALIRTLALDPDLLLLDEPFSALDYQTRLEVTDDIGTIIRREGKTAILVTHDLSEAISMADRIIILSRRPGAVKQILTVSFPEGYDTPLKKRNSEEFSHYFNLIWKELKSHG
ncbi:MAG: ABC transporter ATP-binding protein [Lachnospiraceae bacterium]|jgi:NitT/TauT family transport system ATP-binding protein|nr:ABC transporter ATP-binding protein [Lachnospiraceae bacterium]